MRTGMRGGIIPTLLGLATTAAGAVFWMRNRMLASGMLGFGAAQMLLGAMQLASRRNRAERWIAVRPLLKFWGVR